MEYEQEPEPEPEPERDDLGVQYDCPDCRSYHETIAFFNYELKQLRDQAPHLNQERKAELERHLKDLAVIQNNHQHRIG